MGSEEAMEAAEFGRGKRNRRPSTKQMAAAGAAEFQSCKRNSAQQKEAAERNQRKQAPDKRRAALSAGESAELSVGTVGRQFERDQHNSASSAKRKANEPPEQTAPSSYRKLYAGEQALMPPPPPPLPPPPPPPIPALHGQQKEEARAEEPPEQMAKRSQKKLYDAQVSAEAKKAGISKSEGSPHERCGAAGCE